MNEFHFVKAHIAQPRRATPRMRSGAEAGRTPCQWGGSQEELPHVRGQGQQPRMPGWHGAGMNERSYPSWEVRGSSQEELPHVWGQGRWLRVPGCDSAGAAKRNYPTTEVRGSGREELPLAQGQGQRLGAANPRPRPGAATGRSNPTSKVQWLCGHRRA